LVGLRRVIACADGLGACACAGEWVEAMGGLWGRRCKIPGEANKSRAK
jgi:hypothetical protein